VLPPLESCAAADPKDVKDGMSRGANCGASRLVFVSGSFSVRCVW